MIRDEQATTNELGQTRANTIFTSGQPFGRGHVLYTAQKWFRVKLRLETAGPVTIGFASDITAVGAGSGASLGADEVEVIVKKGDTLYYAANAINRVRMVVEPVPWAEQMWSRVGSILQMLGAPQSPSPSKPKKSAPRSPKRVNFGNVQGRRW